MPHDQGSNVMTLPDYQTLMLPVLRVAAKGETNVRSCIDRLSQELELLPEERSELLPSGKQTKVANRVHWAKTYLAKAGLVEITRRGHFRATSRGLAALSANGQRIDNTFLNQFAEFRAFRARSAPPVEAGERPAVSDVVSANEATPEERIEAAYEEITAELREALLERVASATPEFFEKLIVDLMMAMGYGGSGPDAGRRLGKSGDGGIDGLINEDVLGLDTIYLQAKRYAPGNGIGVDKVREFAGSLVERGANKGVFVTTSHFAPGAKIYADRIPQKLILIDGNMLTQLMVRHSVGVRTMRTISLKRLDLDYFEAGENS